MSNEKEYALLQADLMTLGCQIYVEENHLQALEQHLQAVRTYERHIKDQQIQYLQFQRNQFEAMRNASAFRYQKQQYSSLMNSCMTHILFIQQNQQFPDRESPAVQQVQREIEQWQLSLLRKRQEVERIQARLAWLRMMDGLPPY